MINQNQILKILREKLLPFGYEVDTYENGDVIVQCGIDKQFFVVRNKSCKNSGRVEIHWGNGQCGLEDIQRHYDIFGQLIELAKEIDQILKNQD